MPTHPAMIDRPLRDLDAWVAYFVNADMPVLADTVETLQALREKEDDVDARLLAETVAVDPLMTLNLLVHVSTHRSANRLGDAETATQALVLLGISPFFRKFADLTTVDDWLGEQPAALNGLQALLRRAQRAAHFAYALAIRRSDHDAAVIHEAALLHDFAEMLLWCHAPQLALQIKQLQAADPTLRSAAAQRAVLGFKLNDLQHSLMKTWRLPELLIRLDDSQHADAPSVRNVLLAVRLARHTARGWDNAAVPDDVKEIAELLQMGSEPTLNLLLEFDS